MANRWYGLPYQVQTGSLQNQTFGTSNGYDLAGNPTNLSYADHTGESFNFAYNELDQLLSMGGSASESYGSYLQGCADVGNLLGSRKGNYSYPTTGQAHPHAPNSVSSVGNYAYDGNGNRQSDPSYGYAYDVENHLTKLTQGGTVVLQNTFDGDGNRLVRVANGTTTHYVGEWYEVDPNTGVATVYYPFNGQVVAMKQGSTLYFLHRDQVGSVVSVSNATGNEVGSVRYWPFGGARLTTGSLPTDRLFTGQIRDLGDDRFYFFKARYYDATIGKFVQPDTIVPDAKNPQALNRYAYGLNNPLKFVDPSGHDAMDPNWAARFENEHHHKPSEQDWEAYQYSLKNPGTGPGGSWTTFDWFAYSVLRPIQQVEDWINDPQYSSIPDHLTLAYLEHHAAQLLQSYVVGKTVTKTTAAALRAWFFSRRAEILELDRYGNPLFTTYRGLPRPGGEAVTEFLSKIVGAIPFTGVDETTGASVFGAVSDLFGLEAVAGAIASPVVGALFMFFMTPDTAESE